MLASFLVRDVSERIFDAAPPEIWQSALVALASYGLLFYGIFPNLSIPGIWAVGLGSFLNFIVIVANGARMPVSIANLAAHDQAREIARLSTSINHCLLTDDTRIPFLSDLFTWRFLRSSMFSIGDVLICLGISYLILRVSLRGFRPESARDRMGKAG